MSGWPQIVVAVWLLLSMVSAVGAALPGRKRTLIVLSPHHQRIAAAGFAAAALSEATLLWAGGFWSH